MELLPLYAGVATTAIGVALAIYRSRRGVEPGLATLSDADKAKIFGAPSWKPAPRADEPGAVALDPEWVRENLVTIKIPELEELGKNGTLVVHRAAADSLKALFRAWKEASLLGDITSFDGAWNPRLVRGSTTTLSNHALGTAFDINARENPLGSGGAAPDEKGSTHALERVAWQFGWTTGRRWKRPDPMHFEYAPKG